MPISEKIVNEINKLETTEQEKDLLLEILTLEDNGAKRWKAQYENAINEHIKIKDDNKK